jgi:hypothetical protein
MLIEINCNLFLKVWFYDERSYVWIFCYADLANSPVITLSQRCHCSRGAYAIRVLAGA